MVSVIYFTGKPNDPGESTKPAAGMGHTLMDGINVSRRFRF